MRALATSPTPSAGNAATDAVTLHPGVTCIADSSAEARLSGSIVLDAGGDPNAFFVIRSQAALTVADGTRVVLTNGAQACAVYWRVERVAIGRDVEFYGSVMARSEISMGWDSTLLGRALSQTASVLLDGSTITIPVYDPNDSAHSCAHAQ